MLYKDHMHNSSGMSNMAWLRSSYLPKRNKLFILVCGYLSISEKFEMPFKRFKTDKIIEACTK